MMPSCWELNGLDMGESVSLACFSLVQGSDFILLLGRGRKVFDDQTPEAHGYM